MDHGPGIDDWLMIIWILKFASASASLASL